MKISIFLSALLLTTFALADSAQPLVECKVIKDVLNRCIDHELGVVCYISRAGYQGNEPISCVKIDTPKVQETKTLDTK